MKDNTGLLFSVAGLDALLLTEKWAPALQTLLDRCSDYYRITEGRAALKNAAGRELTRVPPGSSKENLFCLGLLRDDGTLEGVFITVRDYPRKNQWYIELFLLDPGWRGKQVGRSCYLAFENWVKAQNAEAILLSVVAPNERGAKFWESVGFILPRCYPPKRFGAKRHVLIEYEKPLAGTD